MLVAMSMSTSNRLNEARRLSMAVVAQRFWLLISAKGSSACQFAETETETESETMATERPPHDTFGHATNSPLSICCNSLLLAMNSLPQPPPFIYAANYRSHQTTKLFSLATKGNFRTSISFIHSAALEAELARYRQPISAPFYRHSMCAVRLLITSAQLSS